MEYHKMAREIFDAVVTGELVHYALWIESELDALIKSFLKIPLDRTDFFDEAFLVGMNFDKKLQLSRKILGNDHKALLSEIETIQNLRNRMAHGIDCSDEKEDRLILVVGDKRDEAKNDSKRRNGENAAYNRQIVTPETHQNTIDLAESILERLRAMKNK